ncbi:BatA domain-containing protein, partial [Klebsiella pneumoniae]|uniref:BatA domain-containing protein n=1 Tax=Klebsiella pneumoniae TaxID=573 RepID=UPI0038532D0A
VLFTSPWLLGFLVALPAIWWLLRLTPPAPKRVLFPALALLKGLVRREETPAHSPWWLLLLRLAIAVLLIFALAEPQIDPLPAAEAKGTLLV